MKVCPKCNQNYTDPDLNFCLNDGEFLTDFGKDDAPATIFMESSRTTNPNNWPTPPVTEPMTTWQNQNPGIQNQPVGMQNQSVGMQNRPNYPSPMPLSQSKDQILPTISMVLGILSLLFVCCYGGVWLGVPAAVIGFLGMKNADNDPVRYGGRGMAIAGIILGGIGFLMFVGFIILSILGRLA